MLDGAFGVSPSCHLALGTSPLSGLVASYASYYPSNAVGAKAAASCSRSSPFCASQQWHWSLHTVQQSWSCLRVGLLGSLYERFYLAAAPWHCSIIAEPILLPSMSHGVLGASPSCQTRFENSKMTPHRCVQDVNMRVSIIPGRL